MVPRLLVPLLRGRLAKFPAAALVGPRQCGKTTLARDLGGHYFDLEQDSERLRLDLEWPALVEGRRLVVIDEAQSWPEIFPRLRGAIDADRKRNGRFVLLGSISPTLMTQVGESLAGRLSVLELTPFLWNELPTKAARERLFWTGGYPDGGVLAPRKYPRWQLDYLTLLAQRDLPAWGLTGRPQQTERFMRMLAALHGQAWNASQLGQSLGASYHTVNNILDYFVGAFLVRRLPAFHANIGKRLVKSPKVYWRDSGLLHALLNAPTAASLANQPWVGASWEGFVIEQILGVLSQRDRPFEAYSYRTSDQHEIDLLVEIGGSRWAIEIKLTTSPGSDDLARLNRAADQIGANRRILVSQVRESTEGQRQWSCNLPTLLERIAEGLD